MLTKADGEAQHVLFRVGPLDEALYQVLDISALLDRLNAATVGLRRDLKHLASLLCCILLDTLANDILADLTNDSYILAYSTARLAPELRDGPDGIPEA